MPAAARARLKAWLSVAARYLLGFLLVYWLWRTQVLDLRPLKSISATLVMQGLFLGISITVISAYRIRYLMSDQGIHVSFRRCFVYNSIGLFYSLFLPGGISGDAARAYYFFQDAPQKRIAVLGALLLDRFLGLIALIAFGIMSGIFLASMIGEVVPYLVASAIVLGVLVAGLVLGVRYDIQHRSTAGAHWLLRLWEAVRSRRENAPDRIFDADPGGVGCPERAHERADDRSDVPVLRTE